MSRQNRRFCTLPDLNSPRENKNTDSINDTMIMYSASSDTNDTDMASTAHLFKRVQANNRRRYRAILSLVSTMTLIATAVAVISVTVKKMNSKKASSSDSQKDDNGLWFDRNTLAPVDRPNPGSNNNGGDVDSLFTSPPIFATIDVTAPPALIHPAGPTRQPTPNGNSENDNNNNNDGPLFGMPPLSTIRRPTTAPTTSPVVTWAPVEELDGMKRPSLLDLTVAPLPPTLKPTRRPRATPEPTRMPTNNKNRPTKAPFSPFLDIVRPDTSLPPTSGGSFGDTPTPQEKDDDDDDDFAYPQPSGAPSLELELAPPTNAPSTAKPTRRPRPTSTGTPTEAPTMEPAAATEPPTLKPKRTSRPSDAPVTMVPSSEAPVVTTTTAKPTDKPSREPTDKPSREPTTSRPTEPDTTAEPTDAPTWEPTDTPTWDPTTSTPKTDKPTEDPTDKPTFSPTEAASGAVEEDTTTAAPLTTIVVIPEVPEGGISYLPGDLNHMEGGLLLSRGLTAKLIATSGTKVNYENGEASSKVFHGRPDAGGTFVDTRSSNKGGWVYVSNAEMRNQDPPGGTGNGGVGAITFDARGNILDYEMILTQTTWNCGGGRTPWNTWVSCEEAPKGVIWQVDPMGERTSEQLTMGSNGGRWESFTYDISDLNAPHYFVTEDHVRGALIRFTPSPSEINWQKPWGMLHGNGTTDYLQLKPDGSGTRGTYEWVPDQNQGRKNAAAHYPNCEGIDSNGESVYFVSKKLQKLFELSLRDNTYTVESTVRGLMDGRPDQVARILTTGNGEHHTDDILYFTEEGGVDAGVHGRDSQGNFFTILESPTYKDETSGLAFSPDGMHMYIAYQENGVLLDVTRLDGLPFHEKSLNVKYHAKKR